MPFSAHDFSALDYDTGEGFTRIGLPALLTITTATASLFDPEIFDPAIFDSPGGGFTRLPIPADLVLET